MMFILQIEVPVISQKNNGAGYTLRKPHRTTNKLLLCILCC